MHELRCRAVMQVPHDILCKMCIDQSIADVKLHLVPYWQILSNVLHFENGDFAQCKFFAEVLILAKSMGGWLSSHRYYVVYLQDRRKNIVPIEWPRTFANLRSFLAFHYNIHPLTIRVHENSEHLMLVSCEESYRALVPKVKMDQAGISVFYIQIELDTNFQ